MIDYAKQGARRVLRAIRWRSSDRLFWWKGPPYNFGDWIGPYLFERIAGHDPQFARSSNRSLRTVYLTVGSLARWFCQDSIVWGSGILFRNESFWEPYETCSVRGPYTRQRFNALGYRCPEIYGDPAILLPLYFQPFQMKQYRLGVVPHYSDLREASELYKGMDSVLVIDVRRDMETVVSEICSCEKIVASSLHGLIVGQSYNIPSMWVEFSSPPGGDRVKFLDHLASAGEKNIYEPISISSWTSLTKMESLIDTVPQPNLEDLRAPLIETCPFR